MQFPYAGMNGFVALFPLLILALAPIAGAETRGIIYSGACPNSCGTRGIDKSHCRDWREGDTCYVEDLADRSGPAPSPAPIESAAAIKGISPSYQSALDLKSSTDTRHGRITAERCPFTCKSLTLLPYQCREWSEGDTCYVEDLTKNSPGPIASAFVPLKGPTFDRSIALDTSENSSHNEEGSRFDECRSINRYDLARPRIKIHQVKKVGNFFTDTYKVSGNVEGSCLTEAGYYEDGHKAEQIPIITTRPFRRFEFEMKVRAEREPEIRVYNISGDREIYPIDPEAEVDLNRR